MILLLASLALGADALTFDAVRVVEHGAASPSLTFHPTVSGRIDVRLDCGTGRQWTHAGGLSPGVSVTMTLDGIAQGTHTCSGRVQLTDAQGGVGELPLAVEVSSLPLIGWTYGPEDVDLEARTLAAHASRPLQDAVLRVVGVDGQVIEEQRADLTNPSHPRFSWTTTMEVVKLAIEGVDANGFTGLLELSPWSYAIPHEDVVFASGSADLTPAQVPKLDATWADTAGVLDKYGDIVEIQLFVGGYTDTVGAEGANQGLSERRARAIAKWFRNRGFTGTIWYQGFGERGLAVATPDEADEARNRRAVYLLAAQTPPVTDALPGSSWSRLQ
ncbi:MAG: hypothetical protein ACI8PZ_006411 [Myxococcota bacterium]|jgi:hypothetical protein